MYSDNAWWRSEWNGKRSVWCEEQCPLVWRSTLLRFKGQFQKPHVFLIKLQISLLKFPHILNHLPRLHHRLLHNDSFCPITMPLTNGKEYCIIHFWSRIRNFQLATCGGTRQGYPAWERTAGYRISTCHGRNRSWAQRLPSELAVFLRLGTNTVLLVKLETLARKT